MDEIKLGTKRPKRADQQCTVPDCDDPQHALDVCRRHYDAARSQRGENRRSHLEKATRGELPTQSDPGVR